MAKRKRLAAPAFGADSPAAAEESPMALSDAPLGQIPKPRAPIADVAGDAATQAAFEQVAGELSAARSEGRLVSKIPLEAIKEGHLTRDRLNFDEDEMETLKASLKARGQQTPIEVVALPSGGKYGLISGWRRVTALKELHRAGQGPDTVLAFLREPRDAADAYTAMIEENEIRAGLSNFERANMILRVLQEKVFRSEQDAINTLFAAASRAKRSKIKSFVKVARLGTALSFPTAISERLGLALAQVLTDDPGFETRLKDRLRKADIRSAADEAALITRALAKEGTKVRNARGDAADAGDTKHPPTAPEPAKSGVRVERVSGGVKITGVKLSDRQIAEIEALIHSWR